MGMNVFCRFLTEVMDKSLGKRSIAEAIKFENVKERKRASKQKR